MKNIIIRIIALVLVLVCAAAAFVSCGEKPVETTPNKNDNKNPDSDAVEFPEYDFMGNDISGFINLAQYKGLTFEVEPKLVITEEYFADEIRKEIIQYGQNTEIKEGTVKESDIVRIKYEGYKGEEKFEGGTGEAKYFTIYNGGGFIEGFAEGIIGATVGEQFDLHVTFPEDYHATELAGQPVIFKVTVECIYEAKELTDELVKELSGGEMETYAEFKEQAWKLMEENAEYVYKADKANAVWEKIMNETTAASLPEELLNDYREYFVYYYKQVATQNYMTFEKFCEEAGITVEDIYKEAETQLIYETAVYSIIKAEGITLSDEKYAEMLKEMAESNNVTEEVVLQYYSKEELELNFLFQLGYEAVLDINTFVDKAAE